MPKFGHPPPDQGARFQERRRAPRYPVHWIAEVFDPLYNTRLSARIVDISTRGCAISGLHASIEQDTIIQLEIQRKTEKLNLWASVARIAGDQGGLRFLRTGRGDENVLLRWLSEELAYEEN